MFFQATFHENPTRIVLERTCSGYVADGQYLECRRLRHIQAEL